MENFAYSSPLTVKDAAGMLSNQWGAVANAIGVRVPQVPLVPRRILAALERRNA